MLRGRRNFNKACRGFSCHLGKLMLVALCTCACLRKILGLLTVASGSEGKVAFLGFATFQLFFAMKCQYASLNVTKKIRALPICSLYCVAHSTPELPERKSQVTSKTGLSWITSHLMLLKPSHNGIWGSGSGCDICVNTKL